MSVQLPPCPASLKAIQHYLKTASEHDQRDPVVSYWCRLYALQLGLKLDTKSQEAKMLLTTLMDWLETQKRTFADNEAITNDVAAQAHLENYALKLFLYADGQDRAANFGKNVVKAFYTAGMLYDVLTTFGELPEEVLQNRKYAKWKAAYIHNCLKNGETPVAGPMGMDEDEDFENEGGGGSGTQDAFSGGAGATGIGFTQPGFALPPAPTDFDEPPPPAYFPTSPSHTPSSPSSHQNSFPGLGPFNPPPNIPTSPGNDSYNFPPSGPTTPGVSGNNAPSEGSGITLKPDQVTKAQKYCKWASSALNYDDIPTAINNLQKALKLLQTGNDS